MIGYREIAQHEIPVVGERPLHPEELGTVVGEARVENAFGPGGHGPIILASGVGDVEIVADAYAGSVEAEIGTGRIGVGGLNLDSEEQIAGVPLGVALVVGGKLSGIARETSHGRSIRFAGVDVVIALRIEAIEREEIIVRAPGYTASRSE